MLKWNEKKKVYSPHIFYAFVSYFIERKNDDKIYGRVCDVYMLCFVVYYSYILC